MKMYLEALRFGLRREFIYIRPFLWSLLVVVVWLAVVGIGVYFDVGTPKWTESAGPTYAQLGTMAIVLIVGVFIAGAVVLLGSTAIENVARYPRYVWLFRASPFQKKDKPRREFVVRTKLDKVAFRIALFEQGEQNRRTKWQVWRLKARYIRMRDCARGVGVWACDLGESMKRAQDELAARSR